MSWIDAKSQFVWQPRELSTHANRQNSNISVCVLQSLTAQPHERDVRSTDDTQSLKRTKIRNFYLFSLVQRVEPLCAFCGLIWVDMRVSKMLKLAGSSLLVVVAGKQAKIEVFLFILIFQWLCVTLLVLSKWAGSSHKCKASRASSHQIPATGWLSGKM